jgi:diguanylate cyclase (GGDEF)-like protein/PAS domain S-box-containing protein
MTPRITPMTLAALPSNHEEPDPPGPAGFFRALHEHSTDIVTILEPDGAWRTTSPAGTRLLGWPPGHDPGPLGIFSFVHPDDLDQARAAFAEVRAGVRGADEPVHLRVQSFDGRWHLLETRAQDLTEDPHVHGIVVTSRDVTHRRHTEAKVRLLHEVLEVSTELVLLCDRDGNALYANGMARGLLGIVEGDNPLVDIDRLVVPESAALVPAITVAVDDDGAWNGELTLLTAGGIEVPVAITVQMHRDDSGPDEFISVIAHDISELKHTQARLEHQATHDPLTGLPNRALFQELGEQALARSHRYGTTVAVLFLDLDRFKPVNDTFGHHAGDQLLVRVAAVLRASIRRGDVVARFGGDEFVVLCEHPAGQTEMRELAHRLIDALSEPVPFAGTEATVGASVGIAIGGGGRATIDALIRDADAALYQAKERGRGRAVLFGASARQGDGETG